MQTAQQSTLNKHIHFHLAVFLTLCDKVFKFPGGYFLNECLMVRVHKCVESSSDSDSNSDSNHHDSGSDSDSNHHDSDSDSDSTKMNYKWFRLRNRSRNRPRSGYDSRKNTSNWYIMWHRVTWGAPFWRWPQFDLFICINIWKKLHVCNKLYVMCIMTEYHMRSDNMSAEILLLIAAFKMSQTLSCGAKRPGGL